MPDLSFEEASGAILVAGIDEAGCGPLAGPVLAAAVIFRSKPACELAALIDDSKRLDPPAREAAFAALAEAARAGVVALAAGAASADEISRINILKASHRAMARAVARLPFMPELVLVDGKRQPTLPMPVRCIVGGDGLCLSIAAASIIAKVLRDRAMRRLAGHHPAYGWATNMGYPTVAHRDALARFGATRHHRGGFALVDQARATARPD